MRPPRSAPTPSHQILVVAAQGAARETVRRALVEAGHGVVLAREPYEAMERFLERPMDAVVVSLARLRRADLGFVRAVRRRAPRAPILLLATAERRGEAQRFLEAGADALLAEPFYAGEIQALLGALLRERVVAGASSEDTAPRLAAEVAHAVNNPLQILSLLGESRDIPEALRRQLSDEVERIRGVVDILARWGLLGEMRAGPVAMGPSLRAALDRGARDGLLLPSPPAPGDGPPVLADADHLRVAFEALARVLSTRGGMHPQPVTATVRTARSGTAVEGLLRAPGVRLGGSEIAHLEHLALVTDDQTRGAHPGLALPREVARLHGGTLVTRQGRRGTVLGIALPVAG